MCQTTGQCDILFICSDNQHFLKDVVTHVLDGQGVGWLKVSRVKKLMEDENYRNFVVSRLNSSLDRKLNEEDSHIEDVVRGALPYSAGIDFTRQNL